MESLFIPIMAALSRASGCDFLDNTKIKWLPEVLFGTCFGVASYMIHGSLLLALVSTVWSYLWMETGHGIVLHMGRNPASTFTRSQFLTPLVDFLAHKLSIEKGSFGYCWIHFFIKGFLIGFGLMGGAGVLCGMMLSMIWPAAYDSGWRLYERGIVKEPIPAAEILAGAVGGLWVAIITHALGAA